MLENMVANTAGAQMLQPAVFPAPQKQILRFPVVPTHCPSLVAIATKQAQLMEEEKEKEEEGRQPGLQLGDLAVSEVTKDSVRLSWTVREGTFDSFLVQYEDAEGRPQALPLDAGTLTAVVSDLVPSHRYQFHLYGISGQKPHGPVSTDAVTGTGGLEPGRAGTPDTWAWWDEGRGWRGRRQAWDWERGWGGGDPKSSAHTQGDRPGPAPSWVGTA